MIRSCFRPAILFTRLYILSRKSPLCTSVNNSFYKKRLLAPATSCVILPTRGMEHTDLSYKELVDYQQNRNILLIDVRNPDEVADGSIPNSINVPLGELESALKMDDKQFEALYKHKKPQKDTEVIFSCRSGNRSRRALELAQKLGFNKSKHYTGGWLDWVEQTKN